MAEGWTLTGFERAVSVVDEHSGVTSMRMLFVGNQGGRAVVDLNCAIAREWTVQRSGGLASFVVWLDDEAAEVRRQAPFAETIYSYQSFLRERPEDWRQHVDRLVSDYPEVNWAAVIASERSFTDASFLLGGAGNRIESLDYVQRILVNMVRFFEGVFTSASFDAICCQTADSLFTHVLFKVAHRFGVRIRAVRPAWLAEGNEPGFCLTADEYTHAPAMVSAYRALSQRALTPTEVAQAERLRADVLNFDQVRVFSKTMGRGWLVGPLSPHVRDLPRYLVSNYRLNKELDYRRFEMIPKLRANVLRLWRRWRLIRKLKRDRRPLPARYVLMAWHFQPEQSTLVGGIQYTNQVALAEALAKSLPLGWTLVCKEHPKGRGSRPLWQYRHLESYPNVMFSDAPTRHLIRNAGAVVTVTGTVAVEAVAADRPAILMGQTYFDYCDLLYRPASVNELAEMLRHILIERGHEHLPDRVARIHKFLLAYARGFGAGFPSIKNAPRIAAALIEGTDDERPMQHAPGRFAGPASIDAVS